MGPRCWLCGNSPRPARATKFLVDIDLTYRLIVCELIRRTFLTSFGFSGAAQTSSRSQCRQSRGKLPAGSLLITGPRLCFGSFSGQRRVVLNA